jgi:hypothetical protein
LPKLSASGSKVNTALVPMPVTLTVCGLAGALLLKVRVVAAVGPCVVGAKVTPTVQDSLGSSVMPLQPLPVRV